MDIQSTRDDGETMDVDEPTRSTGATASAPIPASHVHRPVPVLPSLSRSDLDIRHYPPANPNGYPDEYYHRRPYESSRTTVPLSPRHAHDDYYWRNRTSHEYPHRYEHRYESRSGGERHSYHVQEHPNSEYYPRPLRDTGPYSPRAPSTDDRDSDYSGRHSPQIRPLRRDPRDRSPRSYPHYPREYNNFSRRDPDIELLDRFERRPPSPRGRTSGHPHHDLQPRHSTYPDSLDPRYDRYIEDHYKRTERMPDRSYFSSREYVRRERDLPLTFVHRSPHTRVRSMEETREAHLPSTRTQERDSSIRDPIDRSHSAGERLMRPAEMDFSFQLGRRSSFHSPEDILDGMRESHQGRGPHYPPIDGTHSPLRHPVAETAAMEQLEPRRLGERRPVTPPPNRSQAVPSVAPRTGFPSSGMRSTAPPTPPVPRITQIDSSIVSHDL